MFDPLHCIRIGVWAKHSRARDRYARELISLTSEHMNFPSNLKYTKDHEWLNIEGKTGTLGITDYAQGELGDVIYLDLKSGMSVSAHESLGTIEAVKTVSDLFTPVSGQVLEVNTALNDTPETVNKDPYGEGWLAKIELSNPSETDGLLSADEYKQLIGQ